jgi:iron complex outermembrane receptor protein
MRTMLACGVAFAALLVPATAFAQSTGTVDAEANSEILVTGSRADDVGGVKVSNTSKNKQVLKQEFISRQTPGQTVNEIINSMPGVSFQNNDPFGSAGGTLTIRGFDSSRISQTFDGIPLNDTGNYAIYSNQQLDPELIEEVNVNLGATDVDSPTASASGSTVNYRTVNPTDEIGARMVGSIGDYSFFRTFIQLNSGVFTPFGTKLWVAASSATNNVVFNDFGKIEKQQYNAKLYQPIGGNGDFIAVSGNYNQNRNNFFGSAPLRDDNNVFTSTIVNGVPTLVTGAVRTAGTASTSRFPRNRDELPYSVPRCQTTPGVAGVNNVPNTCGTTFDERYNPSNTGNIRVNSRFTLTDKLTLTVDPSYQYTKANGGGTVRAQEGGYTQTANATRGAITTPIYGFVGGNYYFGQDLNGDGDVLDRTATVGTVTTNGGVTLLAPSQTITHRYGVISSLRYDFSDSQNLRLGYTLDYGRHRQTGELGRILSNGVPIDVFPVNDGLTAVNGRVVQKRDRKSLAVLNQGFGEYRGTFFDALTVTVGVTAKFFKRDLNNYCFTTAANGNVDCLGLGNTADNAAYAAANPLYAAPQQRNFKYNRVLPNVGFVYNTQGHFSIFGNYSKGVQVPGTDNLYQTFFYATGTAAANPTPETTDNFDGGIRYTSSRIQASVGPWYTRFTNRLAASYDPDTQQTLYRNLGRVDKYGVDGSVSYRPINELLFYAYASYLKSEIKNDVQIGTCTTNTTVNCSAVGAPIFALTDGKRESGAPVYTYGGRIQATLGPLDLGVQAKRTGRRYLNDQNLGQIACTVALVNTICPTVANTTAVFPTASRGIQYSTYGAVAPGYTTVDFDVRLSLDWAGIENKKTYLQFNLQNAFNKYYIGGFTGGSTLVTAVPFVQIGSPRAFIASLNVGL